MMAINNGYIIVVGEENIIYYKIINTFLFIYISNKPKMNLLNIIFNKIEITSSYFFILFTRIFRIIMMKLISVA
jgi:hypothetical protein